MPARTPRPPPPPMPDERPARLSLDPHAYIPRMPRSPTTMAMPPLLVPFTEGFTIEPEKGILWEPPFDCSMTGFAAHAEPEPGQRLHMQSNRFDTDFDLIHLSALWPRPFELEATLPVRRGMHITFSAACRVYLVVRGTRRGG